MSARGTLRTTLPEMALAVPALLWLAAAVAVVAASAMGYSRLAAAPDLTLAEAAALRDRAEVLRLIGAGADPEAPARVRGGIVREQAYMLTPLEAATVMRRDDVVRLLVREGATLSDASFPVLYCVASTSGFDDMVALLHELAPDRPAPSCDGVRLPL